MKVIDIFESLRNAFDFPEIEKVEIDDKRYGLLQFNVGLLDILKKCEIPCVKLNNIVIFSDINYDDAVFIETIKDYFMEDLNTMVDSLIEKTITLNSALERNELERIISIEDKEITEILFWKKNIVKDETSFQRFIRFLYVLMWDSSTYKTDGETHRESYTEVDNRIVEFIKAFRHFDSHSSKKLADRRIKHQNTVESYVSDIIGRTLSEISEIDCLVLEAIVLNEVYDFLDEMENVILGGPE